jgi:hypothetical protein
MNVVIIFNGLGNQMSQYAFYLQQKQLNSNTRILFDTASKERHNGFELSNIFNISYKHTVLNSLLLLIYKLHYVQKSWTIKLIVELLKRFGVSVLVEPNDYKFEKSNFIDRKGISFYYGGWHSFKNFSGVIDQVKECFKLEVSDDKNLSLLKQIRSVNSVSIHIRKGDYLDKENYFLYGAVCSKDYFVRAIKAIEEHVQNPCYFVFTNDEKWVRENITMIDYNLVNINSGATSWKDMFLMSNCEHNINSNSSFSWWAAFLNQNPNKIVITPKEFVYNLNTEDVYPNEWIKISDYKYDH